MVRTLLSWLILSYFLCCILQKGIAHAQHKKKDPLFNKEKEALDNLKVYKDLQTAFQTGQIKRKRLLVATFLNASRPTSRALFHANREWQSDVADFAAVMYDGSQRILKHFCAEAKGLIHCHRATISYTPGRYFYPKPILYPDLLPYLSQYEKVLLIDEDISLRQNNLTHFLNIWDCAFAPSFHPLIVQGLLAEPTQYFHFVHHQEWTIANLSKVLASETVFVEQQMPAFDSLFLMWFIERVLPYTFTSSLYYDSDWGADKHWCKAGKAFAEHIYGVDPTSHYIPCALITGGPPFHHRNFQSFVVKRIDAKEYQRKGDLAVDAWQKVFPAWSTLEVVTPEAVDPTKDNQKYRKSYELNPTCLRS